ncbi:GNAT family N-acetyltransferase [Aliiroseovarius sp. Z3]|uniref:GNAT family N-acetyltransferase n=1 Tax=Aliiroseovarius sp. Z3 TaxID=2811402 RepID=UPI0023B351A1|nr:GNAT family N-acyltransferase [Aliiroseovarius sp. Z3]MDE9449071.1 GNAT family N-acetyltransferase [Aliiroseovarius sp. Z3]
MTMTEPDFVLRLARDEADLIAAQRLRYDVFVDELGGTGDLVDHDARLERDAFDPYFDHLILFDQAREGCPAVGVYRLLNGDNLSTSEHAVSRFYSEDEYDLTPLRTSGRKLLELGRSCLHPDYRGGHAMMVLWTGLADYVTQHEIDLLFGVASFHGTDIDALAAPLSLLHHRHLAPEALRVKAQAAHYQSMNLMDQAQIDRPAAMRAVPSLIKAYLRLGGFVGDGAYIDHDFNTTDVCLIMDTKQMSAKHKAIYAGKARV